MPLWQIWAAGFGAALLAALIVYSPALHGQFVFDDVHMQFMAPHPENLPLRAWTGARPLVGLSYLINFKMGAMDPFWYHVTNVVFHTAISILVFFIVRRILELAAAPRRRSTLVAIFCGAMFLLHPVQTEAVAYVSSRSESLSLMLAFSAWAIFLYRRATAIRWHTVLLILPLFGLAATAKEHVAVLPAVLLLTDYFWNPGFSLKGVWRNWRLYLVLAAAALALGVFMMSYLTVERTAGFGVKEFTWYQYLFTQCRMLFLYFRLLVLPYGQTVDYAIRVSRTPFEHGAIFGMAALLAAAVSAFIWRKRFPIASYGFFTALIFFLPTSSFVPIKDLATERRVYLPMIGLLLIAAQFLIRVKTDDRRLTAVLSAVILLSGWLTWNRNHVWSSEMALWSDTAEKSPEKPRAHFGLGVADYRAGKCRDAIKQYEALLCLQGSEDQAWTAKHCDAGLREDQRAAESWRVDKAQIYSNYALALDCGGRTHEAVEFGKKSLDLSPGAAIFAEQALYVGKDGDLSTALDLLVKAEAADPAYVPTYIERGDLMMALDRIDEARQAFQKALALEPENASAAKGLAILARTGSR